MAHPRTRAGAPDPTEDPSAGPSPAATSSATAAPTGPPAALERTDAGPELERTGDRKVSLRLARAGGTWRTVVANTHGLPAGISCPGRTTVCAGPTAHLPTGELERLAEQATDRAGGRGRDTMWRHVLPAAGLDPTFPCYVVADLRRGTEENAAYRNWARLRPHLHDAAAWAEAVGATLDAFYAEACAAGVEPWYRLHWDGDIPTPAAAAGIAAALRARPHVRAWTYTRSLFALEHLPQLTNLVVYVSVDADNAAAAAPLLAAHPRLRAAALAADAGTAASVLASLGRRPAPVCPVDSGKLPVVTTTRGGEPALDQATAVGACAVCRLCLTGRADVRFTVAKTPFRPPRQPARTGPLPPEQAVPALFARSGALWQAYLAALRELTGVPAPAHDVTTAHEDSTAHEDTTAQAGAAPGGLGVVYRRTYATIRDTSGVLARAQGRGHRLVLVLPAAPPPRPATPATTAARDAGVQSTRLLTGRHQCPGVFEITVNGPDQVRAAAELTVQAAATARPGPSQRRRLRPNGAHTSPGAPAPRPRTAHARPPLAQPG